MITPRVITGNVYEVKGQRYRIHFLNLSRMYEFTWVADESGCVGYLDGQLRTEQQVADAITNNIIKTI